MRRSGVRIPSGPHNEKKGVPRGAPFLRFEELRFAPPRSTRPLRGLRGHRGRAVLLLLALLLVLLVVLLLVLRLGHGASLPRSPGRPRDRRQSQAVDDLRGHGPCTG